MYITRTAIVTMVYRDTLTRGVGERTIVRVQYPYCHSYYSVQGYSDKRGGVIVCVHAVSLVPRPFLCGWEKRPGTHCWRMRLIPKISGNLDTPAYCCVDSSLNT